MSSDIPASPASLRDSISLLTGLLQGVSPSHSSERLTENVSRPWENLQSVTTLLTTGDPVEDPNGDSVVAATYSTGPNGIEALLVKNTRPSDVHNTLIAPQVTRLIDTPLDDNQVEELLRKWWVLRREDHERNLFHFLNYFIRRQRSGRDGARFSKYIVNVCYPKIFARMSLESNQKLFASSPIAKFREYAPKLAPDTTNPFPWRLEIKGSSPDLYIQALAEYCDLHPDREGKFLVDKSNVAVYVDAMSNAFTTLGNLLRDDQLKSGKFPKPKAELARQDVTAVLTQLYILAAFISLRLVEKLLSDRRVLSKICLLAPGEEEEEEEEDSSDEEYSARRLREESGEAYILRYLKSIVAWLPAIDVGAGLPLEINPHSVLFPRPQVKHEDLHNAFPRVTSEISRLEASSTIDSEPDLRNSKALGSDSEAEFSSSSETDSSCISALNTLFKAKYPENAAGDNHCELPVLHAEAALMSAARSTRAGLLAGLPVSSALRMAFMGEETMIGVSKKCCWCCWNLGRLLNEDKESNLTLMLPGTHSIIHSWCPPGSLPTDILLRLEQDLLDVLKKRLDKKGRHKGSNQSVRSSAGTPPRKVLENLKDLVDNATDDELSDSG